MSHTWVCSGSGDPEYLPREQPGRAWPLSTCSAWLRPRGTGVRGDSDCGVSVLGTNEGTQALSKEVRWLLIALTALLSIYLVGVLVVFLVLSAVSGTSLEGMSPWSCTAAAGNSLHLSAREPWEQLSPGEHPPAHRQVSAAGSTHFHHQNR